MAASEPKEYTPAQRQMLRRLTTFRRRYLRDAARAEATEQARTDLYLAARELDPPLTFKDIADVFEVTEAAVMQKVRRHEVSTTNGTKAMRGSRPAKPGRKTLPVGTKVKLKGGKFVPVDA